MTWLKMDDNFITNPKLLSVEAQYKALYFWLCGFSAKELTDGVIQVHLIPVISAMVGLTSHEKGIAALVKARLLEWDEEIGAYQIHDFLKYNPSRKEVLEMRDARAEAGRKGGTLSGESRRSKSEANAFNVASINDEAKANPVPGPVPGPGPEPDQIPEKYSADALLPLKPPQEIKPEKSETEQRYSPGQRLFLAKFNRKVFHTKDEAKAIYDLEQEVGYGPLEQSLTWAAENNIRNMGSIRTRARNIAKGNGSPRAGPSPPNTKFQQSLANTEEAIDHIFEGGSYFGQGTG